MSQLDISIFYNHLFILLLCLYIFSHFAIIILSTYFYNIKVREINIINESKHETSVNNIYSLNKILE